MTDYSINKQDKTYKVDVKTDNAYLAAKLIKIIREHDTPIELTVRASETTHIRKILDDTDVFPAD